MRDDLTAACKTESEKERLAKIRTLQERLNSMLRRDCQSCDKWEIVENKIIFYQNPERN